MQLLHLHKQSDTYPHLDLLYIRLRLDFDITERKIDIAAAASGVEHFILKHQQKFANLAPHMYSLRTYVRADEHI